MSKKPIGLDPALTAVTVKYLKACIEADWEHRKIEREYLLPQVRRNKKKDGREESARR